MKKMITAAAMLLSVNMLSANGYDYGYSSGNRFSVDAEFLYWSINDNLPLGIDISLKEATTQQFAIDEQFVDVKLKGTSETWKPGFRAGLGWSGDNCLDMKGSYTWYYNKDTDNVTGHLDVQWPFGAFTRSLNYNLIDWELGRTFDLCSVIFRPFCGVRGAWISQKHHARLTGYTEVFTSPPGEIDLPLDYSLTHKIWGVGPRMGVDTSWGNYGGFSILANTSFSALYGRETFNVKVVTTSAASNGQEIVENITEATVKDGGYDLVSSFQMFFGIGWKQEWSCKYAIQVRAGWESILWWNTTNLLFFDKSLSLQGLTAAVQFDF